jgi:hypothetical protein
MAVAIAGVEAGLPHETGHAAERVALVRTVAAALASCRIRHVQHQGRLQPQPRIADEAGDAAGLGERQPTVPHQPVAKLVARRARQERIETFGDPLRRLCRKHLERSHQHLGSLLGGAPPGAPLRGIAQRRAQELPQP